MDIDERKMLALKHGLLEAGKKADFVIRKCDSIEKKICEMRFKCFEIKKDIAEHGRDILNAVKLK